MRAVVIRAFAAGMILTVVGLPGRASAGSSAAPGWFAQSNQASALFGISVASAGDVNGDGYDDVMGGADGYTHGQSSEGGAFLFLGSAAGPSRSPNWRAESNQADAYLGIPVASAGDVNGDGYDDVAAGAFGYDHGQTDEGEIFLFLGSAAGPSIAPDWTAESNQQSSHFGASVASAGDVNGDGYDDVIIGAPNFSFATTGGRAFLFLGSSTGPSRIPDWTAEGTPFSSFGSSAASAGDVNGDGYDDVIVGANLSNNGEGEAFIYLGSAAGPSATPDWTARGHQPNGGFGGSVASAGNVNGDGYGDVIVGASSYSHGQNAEGGAFVFLGSATGPSTTPDWTAESNQANSSLGVSVGSAGDVDADGFADVMAGAWFYDNGETDEGAAFAWFGPL